MFFQESYGAVNYIEKAMAAGTLPCDLAILLANERVYAPIVLQILKNKGIKANFAVASYFRDSSLGTWLQLLSSLSSDPSDIHRQLEILHHPLSWDCLQQKQNFSQLEKSHFSELWG